MKLSPNQFRHALRRTAAFSMVEIALCIAIVAIAMVAIMGVMPLGLSVQKQNREDTIIDQEAQILIDAIRGGATRLDELTNYVDFVLQTHQPTDAPANIRSNSFKGQFFSWPLNSPLAGIDRVPAGKSLRPEDIVGLLSLPKLMVYRNQAGTNTTTAQMRAFSGPLEEKMRPVTSGKPKTNQVDFAFRYQVTAEVIQVPTGPEAEAPFVGRDVFRLPVFNVRLTFRWPVFLTAGEYQVGNSRKTYSTQVSAQLKAYPNPKVPEEIFGSGLFRHRFDASALDFSLFGQ